MTGLAIGALGLMAAVQGLFAWGRAQERKAIRALGQDLTRD